MNFVLDVPGAGAIVPGMQSHFQSISKAPVSAGALPCVALKQRNNMKYWYHYGYNVEMQQWGGESILCICDEETMNATGETSFLRCCRASSKSEAERIFREMGA